MPRSPAKSAILFPNIPKKTRKPENTNAPSMTIIASHFTFGVPPKRYVLSEYDRHENPHFMNFLSHHILSYSVFRLIRRLRLETFKRNPQKSDSENDGDQPRNRNIDPPWPMHREKEADSRGKHADENRRETYPNTNLFKYLHGVLLICFSVGKSRYRLIMYETLVSIKPAKSVTNPPKKNCELPGRPKEITPMSIAMPAKTNAIPPMTKRQTPRILIESSLVRLQK